MNIILASASKRRTEILSSCGIKHEVMISAIEEKTPNSENIREVVCYNALIKAKDIAKDNKDSIVIGADTLVKAGDLVVGKPTDDVEAKSFLDMFSENTIEVFTGMALVHESKNIENTLYDRSVIKVPQIPSSESESIFPLLKPYDKAGGFSIEGVGALIFDDIEGSYFNILGLPIKRLKDLFKKCGLDLYEFISCG